MIRICRLFFIFLTFFKGVLFRDSYEGFLGGLALVLKRFTVMAFKGFLRFLKVSKAF